MYDLMFQVEKTLKVDLGAQFPELQTLYTKVTSNPRIKDYVANRKDTAM